MEKHRMLSISDILEHAPRGEWSDGARPLIERAYAVAERAHAGEERKTGEPYIQHPLAVALLLTDMGMAPDTVAAGLLHDVVEDSDIGVENLASEFGPHIARLVDGVTKLDRIEQEQNDRFKDKSEELRDEQESENLRKLFMAMARDVRVVVIKLADRLHNMRTLDGLKPERRKTFSRETLDIFAPLANRLGVWQWKWELEDLSLRYLDPATYEEITSLIEERRQEREASVQEHIEILERKLSQEKIETEISGRPKHIYSIYSKMQRKEVPFSQIYDVRGIRCITPQGASTCYRILGIVHGLWKPIPGEFDDYIANPKDNGYQSLHTAVIGADGKTLEVQIRTRKMHQVAEYGVAAHWRYKEGEGQEQNFEAKSDWQRVLTEWRQETSNAKDFIDAMKTDIFQDRVYAFTPKGKLIDLPVGATPIDFAYRVHTEIGHRCRGARVNGKLVSLDYQLQNGDQVEILTTRRGGPNRDWLNPALGHVKTNRARSKIRQWFRHLDQEQNVDQGREIVRRELKRIGLEMAHEQVADLFGYSKLESFYAAVGFGDINSQQITSKVASARGRKEKEYPTTPPAPVHTIEGIQVRGTGNLLTRLAHCCHPLPGHAIVGYVTRGHGVTIHRRDCPNILRLKDTERLIEASWGPKPATVPVTVYIEAFDRTRLLTEISAIIGDEDINISSLSQRREENISTFYITIEIDNFTRLSRVLTRIERLPNVIEARRHTG